MPQQVTIYKKIIFGTTDRKVLNSAPDTKFMELRVQSSATSGDNRAIYNRLYMTGAAGGGESLRSYTDVVGVAVGTVHGAHISCGFGESTTGGKATGLAVAVRATLGLPNVALGSGGTYAALMAEIYSFGSSSSPAAVTELSFIKCSAGGDGTGAGRVDDKAYLLTIEGVAEGAGNMIVASATEAYYASAARCLINGVEKWLMFASQSG